MQTYNGQYYNSLTDTTVAAAVTLTPKQITIEMKDEHGVTRQVFWFWDQVKRPAPGRLEYPGYPAQAITVSALTFADAVTYHLERKKHPQTYAHRGRTIVLSVITIVVGLVALVYFWFIPFLAARIANNIPISYEEKLGQSSYDALMQQYKVLPEATKQVNNFFKELHIATRYPVQITVVHDQQSNAFALPGGHIIVYDQLLHEMQHYEELAALLSHEYAHVQLRHTTKTIFRSMGTYMFISLIFGDLGGAGAVVVENANSLKSLQYSRRLEREADLYGLELLEERHINPQGFAWLFNTLKKQNGLQPAEWLSSHPDLDKRIRYIEAHTRQGNTTTDSTLLRIFMSINK